MDKDFISFYEDILKPKVIEISDYDGYDENDNEIEPTENMIRGYDYAIRIGDLEYIDAFANTFGHKDVSVLQQSEIDILKTVNFESLEFLDEQDFFHMPDIVRAIIFDDPYPLIEYNIDSDILELLLENSSKKILISKSSDISRYLSRICKSQPSIYNKIIKKMKTSSSDIKDEVDEILREIRCQG